MAHPCKGGLLEINAKIRIEGLIVNWEDHGLRRCLRKMGKCVKCWKLRVQGRYHVLEIFGLPLSVDLAIRTQFFVVFFVCSNPLLG